MPDDLIADKSFFLTRQIANLMEDFARETSRSSSIFLIYGAASVGKSRVLDELARRHFSGNVVHRIDFNTDKDRKDEGNDSAEASSNELPSKLQRLIQDASHHDIIIVDHFESASNKARHQIFQSWAIDGLDKKLNLIIAADSSQFDEVRQLAKQYQASVKSFKLKSFSWGEIEAFVSFYLFPKESSGRLSIPADIQKQFKNSRGLVGKLIEIVSREGVSTAIKLDDKSATLKKPLFLVGVLSVILLVASFLYPLSDQQDEPPSQTAKNDVTESPEIKPDQIPIVTEESEPEESIADQSVLETSEEPVEPESNLAMLEQPVEPVLESEQDPAIISQDEDTVKQVELIPEDDSESVAEPTENSDQRLTRFQQELNNSLIWIENSDKKLGTIQIMSIGFDGFAENAYYDYLDKLIQQDIDVSRVRIYQTKIAGRVVYSVIFGEYENRREASKGIQLLPEALKANKPLPRTIGGIWDEIIFNR
jgi:hypothetical protein